MNYGLNVKIARIRSDKKQYEVANEVGISSQYLRLIEAGKAKNPSKEVMEKLAKSLDSTVSELFFSESE